MEERYTWQQRFVSIIIFHSYLTMTRFKKAYLVLNARSSHAIQSCVLLTLPYLACHAKKYKSAPRGCPTTQKLTQKNEFPMALPSGLLNFSKGAVTKINGSWNSMAMKATPIFVNQQSQCMSTLEAIGNIPIRLCVGTPTRISCSTADTVKTTVPAANGLQPRVTSGMYTCRFIKV